MVGPQSVHSETTARARVTTALLTFFLAAAVVMLGGCAPPAASESAMVSESVTTQEASASTSDGVIRSVTVHDGTATGSGKHSVRNYRIFVPTNVPEGENLPVLIAIHGAGGNAQRMATYTGLSGIAARDGFIVVYPEGTIAADVEGEFSWNAGMCCGIPARAGINDVAFIDSTIRDVTENFAADPARVFVAGFSNGGMLANRIACESSEPIAGIAVVAGALSVSECSERTPMPVLIVHGTGDETVPYEGGATNARTGARFGSWLNPSVQDAIDAWVGTNGCGTSSNSVINAEVTSVGFDRCSEGGQIVVVTVQGGKHIWPKSPDSAVDASVLIVEFFGLGGAEATLAR